MNKTEKRRTREAWEFALIRARPSTNFVAHRSTEILWYQTPGQKLRENDKIPERDFLFSEEAQENRRKTARSFESLQRGEGCGTNSSACLIFPEKTHGALG
jgi:hypothetical protein